MTALLAAIQFLTISPAFVRRPFEPRELGQATGFYPLVGLLLGGLLALADAVMGLVLPVPVRSALVLALWITLTGALHFDGFLDACDGLFGGTTPERRMEIMRDERSGAFAVAGGGLLLVTMFSSLSALVHLRLAALLLAPTLGRLGMTLAIVAFPYARAEGIGRDIKANAHRPQAVIGSFSALVVVAILIASTHSYAAAAALLSAAIVWYLSCRFMLSRIPGMTGDTYGAICMLIEATVLVSLVALQ